MSHEPVIGLEVHVQLKTATKMFCSNAAEFGAEPNTNVCPVCLGLPGALPVINMRAVELAVRAALGLGCTVHEHSVFARKNYFYPDLPKGYQITQFDRPVATDGEVMTGAGDETRRIRIRRIHLEEDAGKSLHDRFRALTAIDLNRAGVPLVEIVTEPDIASPAQAREYLTRLKQTLQYLDVSDCDMEKGSLRVDANVSVRPQGTTGLGTKTEVKNMNSFANVERALNYEIERQIAVVSAGGRITQETLLWDAARGEARPMRSKEESHDYRYFPEPDLPVLRIERQQIDAIRDALPELPVQRAQRFRSAYGIPAYNADVLTATRSVADYFEAVVSFAGDAKAASNWVMTDVLGYMNQSGDANTFPLEAEQLGQLIKLVTSGKISNSIARQVFGKMIETGHSAAVIVDQEGLSQIRDSAQLEAWADEVLSSYPDEAARYRGGDEKLMAFFMGQVMKKSRGKADPRQATDILKTKLS